MIDRRSQAVSRTGLEPAARSSGTRRRRCSTRTRCARTRACSPRAARSSSTPACTRAARRRTSSSCASPASEDRIWWGDVNQPLERGALRRAAREGRRATSARATLYVVDAFAGADPAHRIARPRRHRPRLPRAVRADDVHHADRRTSSSGSSREAVVLHAPGLEADPEEDGTRTGTFIVLHPTRHEVLIGGTFYAGEIKKSIFTLMNDRLPLEGVLADALLGERRRRRRRRDLLRPVGHRQDDALGRSAAPADRRRRARLGRRGRLQLRGRLLREGDQALGRGRAGDLRRRRARSGRSSRTSSSTSAAGSTSTTTRRPRTRAPRTSSSRSRTRCRTKMAGHPTHVVFLTADAFACCRRSRG